MIRQGTTSLIDTEVLIPTSLEQAWDLKEKFGETASFIAGGTLMQTHWAKGFNCPLYLISLDQVNEVKGWGKDLVNGQSYTRLGASITLDFCRQNKELFHPLLVEAARNIAAPAVRNKATIGGNIANGFGDMIPALLAMDAVITVFDGNLVHLQPFYDFIKNHSQSLIISVQVPDDQTKRFFYKKLCHRESFTPSIVTVAGTFHLNEKKELSAVRLAVSGSTTQPQRLYECERLLEGSAPTNDQLQKLFQTIEEEFTPTTDVFSTAIYKKSVAANWVVSEIARLAT
ncbi:FAD binding domain-containing protein [Robertmurraya korlensis]|uniref:FAD binding domain-containing protein n=1 Tax=Robertmurraya korlensis TaxID=519977 RepID=UPI00203E71EE|nr:FAD binding domain-containing protein [Robertmurraya korlensis]MCM3600490.1 FAD binding domain-containing protein [Robertmurraya korlensis]